MKLWMLTEASFHGNMWFFCKISNHFTSLTNWTPDHIYFKNQIMKVSLATQIFSLSVANAIDHCRENLKIPGF